MTTLEADVYTMRFLPCTSVLNEKLQLKNYLNMNIASTSVATATAVAGERI